MIYGSWNIRCQRRVILAHFLAPWQPGKSIIQLKKTAGDIIILHICTTNDNHLMHGSWDMEHDRQFSVILECLFPFYPLWTHKIKIFKKWKKKQKNTEDIIILQICTINGIHMMYGSSDMECNGQNVFVILDHFLHFYPPNNSFEKILKKPLEVLSFYTGVP